MDAYFFKSHLAFYLLFFGWIAVSSEGWAEGQQEPQRSIVVAELFTSQGCSSCPPADRLLTNLHQRFGSAADVLVLSYHVDYWNYLGWEDPYSLPESTALQRALAKRLTSGVFTPQTVFNGRKSTVGNRAREVESAFRGQRKILLTPLLQYVSVSPDGHILETRLKRGGSYLLHLVGFKTYKPNSIPRGENSGRTLGHTHSVVYSKQYRYEGKNLRARIPVDHHQADISWAVLLRDSKSLAVLDFQRLP